MQIDRFNHLQFPRENAAAATGKEASSAHAGMGLGKAPVGLPLLVARSAAAGPESVVLNIQLPDDAGVNTVPDTGVYSDARKTAMRGGVGDDAAHQANEHQRAVDRNAGVFTRITLNKEGVLVANRSQPQATAEAKQPDFVALAVSAMREFSDEAERQKVQSFDFNAAPVEAPVNKFRGLQQLAARFNVFA